MTFYLMQTNKSINIFPSKQLETKFFFFFVQIATKFWFGKETHLSHSKKQQPTYSGEYKLRFSISFRIKLRK